MDSLQDHPEVEIVSKDLKHRVIELRGQPGRDIWLYGGGRLFSQLLSWNLVDTFEPAVIPVLLGGGVPFLPSPAVRRYLKFIRQSVYPSGMILLEYEIQKNRLKEVHGTQNT